MTKKPPSHSQLRAAVYCRISLSRFGDSVKVDDQEQVCRKLADTKGWTVATEHVYKDNSVSAWRTDRKRPGWDAMLDAVTSGEVDAIIVFHGDRLIRQPRDLEDLIDLAQKRGIQLASPTGTRDLGNYDDQFILRIEAAAAHREVGATSRRMKAMYERMAQQGVTRLGGRGGRAFGFEPDGRTIRDADAAIIREVADRVLAGEPLGAVCRDLNTRGYRTAAGNPWDHGALKKLMLRPRIAGLLPESRGHLPAAWPAILDRDVWEAVAARLRGKAAGFGYTTNARRYLLTGIALCGSCHQPVAIRHNTRSETLRGYGCINPACRTKVHRSVGYLDPYVEGIVVERLNDPAVQERATAPDAAPLITELGRLEQRREQRLEAFADDDDPLAADVLRVTVRRIDQQIAEVRGQLAAISSGHALDGLWGLTFDQWDALPLARRRAAVQALVRVTILPSGRRGPGFDPASVRVEFL